MKIYCVLFKCQGGQFYPITVVWLLLLRLILPQQTVNKQLNNKLNNHK